MFHRKSDKCLICKGKRLSRYLSLGECALANSFLTEEALDKPEHKFPLEVYFCRDCYLAQLLDIVDRELIYRDYAYFSSTSPMLVKHFEEYAKEVFSRYPKQSRRLVADIGSNDGVLLKPFKKMGARVLGIDPAENIAVLANSAGIETIADFFNKKLALKLIKKYGKAGIITSNNALAHTDILHDIFAGVKEFLSRDGVFVFEVQYLVDLLEHNEFDNTYHEHICYHSLHPLSVLLKMHGMGVIDVIRTDTHGGGIMVFASHKGSDFPTSEVVFELLESERLAGLYKLSTYRKFAERPPMIKKKLTCMLSDLKKNRKSISAYGASAKGSTLLQYCGFGPDVIDYITDDAPSKQGKYMPGTHIPIVPSIVLREKIPDYILITAWNYASNIMAKESWFKEVGGSFIVPIPEPAIIEA